MRTDEEARYGSVDLRAISTAAAADDDYDDRRLIERSDPLRPSCYGSDEKEVRSLHAAVTAGLLSDRCSLKNFSLTRTSRSRRSGEGDIGKRAFLLFIVVTLIISASGLDRLDNFITCEETRSSVRCELREELVPTSKFDPDRNAPAVTYNPKMLLVRKCNGVCGVVGSRCGHITTYYQNVTVQKFVPNRRPFVKTLSVLHHDLCKCMSQQLPGRQFCNFMADNCVKSYKSPKHCSCKKRKCLHQCRQRRSMRNCWKKLSGCGNGR